MRPVINVLVGSFTDMTGSFSLNNFAMVFNHPTFWPAFWNTAIIVVVSVTLEFFAALALALLINRKFWGSSYFLFLVIIPMALPRWLQRPCGKRD